jgi:hypothetical protein
MSLLSANGWLVPFLAVRVLCIDFIDFAVKPRRMVYF